MKYLVRFIAVVAAAPPVGEVLAVDPGELGFALEQALLGDRDDQKAVEQAVDQVGSRVTRLISRIRVSALKRGSLAQSTRKRKNASRLSVCPGPALTNTGFSSVPPR